MSKPKNNIVTYICYKHDKKPSSKVIRGMDFVFIDNGDKTYDVMKNKWNGKIIKGIDWHECMKLVKKSENFWKNN